MVEDYDRYEGITLTPREKYKITREEHQEISHDKQGKKIQPREQKANNNLEQ